MHVSSLPTRGRVAVLLRGESFRCVHAEAACNKDSVSEQLHATRTLVSHVIIPLEARHLQVDVVLSSCSRYSAAAHNHDDALHLNMVELLGRHRLLASSDPRCRNLNQGESIRRTIDLFVSHAKMPKSLPKDMQRSDRLRHIPVRYTLVVIAPWKVAMCVDSNSKSTCTSQEASVRRTE